MAELLFQQQEDSESGLQRAIDRFEKSERVLVAIAYRNVLPLSISERLITLVDSVVLPACAATVQRD